MTAPTTEPIREQVLVAVKARLDTITTDDGYYTTPKLVTREVMTIEQYNEFPVIGMAPDTGSTLTLQAQREAYLDEFAFRIWGYVMGSTTTAAMTLVQRLWDDVVRCLLMQPGLDGLVQILRPNLLEIDAALRDPYGGFVQSWQAQLIQPFRVDPG